MISLCIHMLEWQHYQIQVQDKHLIQSIATKFSICYIVNSKKMWHTIIYLCDQTLLTHSYD